MAKLTITPDKLRLDVQISPNDLESAMLNQPSLAAYYGEQAATARKIANDAKVALESLESRILTEKRNEATARREKPVEARIKSEIDADPRFIKAKLALNQAIHTADLCAAAVEAFRHRRDMIVQVVKGEREEMEQIRTGGGLHESMEDKRQRVEKLLEERRRASARSEFE